MFIETVLGATRRRRICAEPACTPYSRKMEWKSLAAAFHDM
jgi:hypothetical protein